MQETFEQFLQGIHSKLYPLILDDDLPDNFDSWLSELDQEKLIDWAELWGRGQYLAGQAKILK